MTTKLETQLGPIKRSDAKRLERELLSIESQQGRLTAESVVKAAQSPRSPLHRYFTWNDGEAAHNFRLWEARKLIASVRVVYWPQDEQSIRVRAFLNVRHGDDQDYFGTARIMGDEDLRTSLLQDAMLELRRFKEKYGALRELAAIFAAIDDL